MDWKTFKKIQREGSKNALIQAENKVKSFEKQGLTTEEAINKILVEGYK